MLMLISNGLMAADNSSGCGLGWMILKKNSLVSSSLRSTTHGFLPNTFSMTTGTSGCTRHSIVKKEMEAIYFAEANHVQLKSQMAKGEGEYLNAFAEVMGCGHDQTNFSKSLKAQYEKIYPHAAAFGVEVIHNVINNIDCPAII